MTDALEQAKALQHEVAITTIVRVPLDVLEGLIVEIERLRDLQSGNRPGVNAIREVK